MKEREYAIIFEKGPSGWGAYAPDLPGLGAAAETFEETDRLIREGIKLHIEVLIETGNLVPEPTTLVSSVAVAA
jgi:predicted RNase H-like HicB family nuclease